MAQALGSKALVTYQKEVTFKTDPSPDTSLLYFSSESMNMERPNVDSNVLRGNRNPEKPVRGNTNVSGSITTELQAYIGGLIEGVLGSVTTTPDVDEDGNAEVGSNRHVIKVGDSVPSFLIEKHFTDITVPQYYKFNGCKINSMSLSITTDGMQEISFDLVGAKQTLSGTVFDATPKNLTKVSFDSLAVGTIEEGGGAIATVTSVDLTMANNLDDTVYTVGGAGERYSLPAGLVNVTGTLNAVFEDVTLYNKALNSTESSLKVKWITGTGAGTLGNEVFQIEIPELNFSPNTPTIEGPTGIQVSLPFTGFYTNDAAASALVVTLANAQTTLYTVPA